MIDYKYKELFNQDSVNKQIKITFDGGEITDKDFYSEEFELTESLCSESELRFGSCEASMLKFKVRNEFGELKGKWLTVSMVLDSHTDKPFQFGRYKVFSDEPSGDKKYTNVTAYDAMYDIINAEMVEWYDGLTFPMTLKDFRDSFFVYLGVEQEETALIQDDIVIEKTIDADSISGRTVISAICELNGVLGHINRQGKFTYVSLERKLKVIHPSKLIHPGKGIYPGMLTYMDYDRYDISKSLYRTCEYEDFETERISKVQIRQQEGDIGAIAGTGNNCYIVEDNFLVYGKIPEKLSEICERLLQKISEIKYRPFKAVVKGNPCIEVGDIVNIQTRYKEVEGYVFERTLTGIQALKDSFETKGVQEYSEKVNSTNREIKRLKGKTNILTRNVEETREMISDVESGLSTEIIKNTQLVSQTISETNKKLENETSALKSSYSNLEQKVNEFDITFQEKLEKINEQGEAIEDLKSTSYKFGTEDLTIKKSNSEMETKINENGMRVYKNSEEVLVANNNGVDAVNLHAKTYLIIGNNSRLEDFGSERTACFWVGEV